MRNINTITEPNFTRLFVGLVRSNIKGTISEEICLPLYSILLSVGNPVVDYFSLDVEGAEMGILKSIPWDKVDIKVRKIINKELRSY